MKRVFVGTDRRSPLFHQVTRHSIERHTRDPEVVVQLLDIDKLPFDRGGTTDFTYSRFLCPWLCGFEGVSVFCDNDQVVVGDIAELVEHCTARQDWTLGVMKEQEPYEWPSVMVFNNARCRILTPEFVQDDAHPMYGLEWTESEEVLALPREWNHCVGYAPPDANAKLLHFTQGPPYWPECRGLPEDRVWWQEYEDMLRCGDWVETHGESAHFKPVVRRMLRRGRWIRALTTPGVPRSLVAAIRARLRQRTAT